MILKNIKTRYKARQATKRVKTSITKRQKAVRKRIRARGKRVGVEFRVAATRKFDGILYYVYDFVTSKHAANLLKNEQHSEGNHVRVIVVKGGYAIYIRPKGSR